MFDVVMVLCLVIEIISYDAGGLRGVVKRKMVYILIKEKKYDSLCIRETKFEVVGDFLCVSLWGSNDMRFFYWTSTGVKVFGLCGLFFCGYGLLY